jgi:MFS family permease
VTALRRRTGSYRMRLALMIFAIAGMNIGYTAILPFLPQIQRQLRLTPVLLTAFLLAYPAAKIVTQAWLGGRMTDRYGPAATAALAWTVGAAGMTLIALAGSPRTALLGGPATAICGRLVWGTADGLGVPAIYRAAGLMSDHYDVPVARLRAAVGAGAVLTLALGPVLAGIVQLFAGFSMVLLIGALLSLLGAVSAAYAMRFPGSRRSSEPASAVGSKQVTQPGQLLPLVAFGFFELILNLLFGATEPLVPLYESRHAQDPASRSAFILAAGLGVWVVVTLLSGRGPDWVRRPGVGIASLALLAVSCVGLSRLWILPLGLAAITLFMVAQGHGYLVARAGIDAYTDGSGTVWGRFNAIGDVGFLVGPLAAMTAYAVAREFAFALLGAGTLAAAAAYALLCAVLGRRQALAAADAWPEAGSSAAQPQPQPQSASSGR